MAIEVEGLDTELLESTIRSTYTNVATSPEMEFMFPTGRGWAADLGYPVDLLARVPEAACAAFAGVANPFSLGPITAGERVIDIGCGAGTDSLIAAQMVGPTGRRHGGGRAGGDRERDVRRGPRGGSTVRRRQLRRRDLERRLRPPPGQGPRLRGGLPRAATGRTDAVRRRHDPAPGQRGGTAEHRPLGRLNRRRPAGSGVRGTARRLRLRADRDRRPDRHLRPLGVRGHTPQGREVRRPRHDDQGVQAGVAARWPVRLQRVDRCDLHEPDPTQDRRR